MFYSVTSHGQLGAARACARHVCSRLVLLASSSPNITENTDILYCRINMRCKGEGMGVSGGQRGKSSLTGAMVRYGHIDANALWPRPLCRVCRQKPANVSSSKTHKRQEPCLMAHQHRQKASGHLDGCDLVLCKLTFGGCLHRTCTM